jgi:hypothetical protein
MVWIKQRGAFAQQFISCVVAHPETIKAAQVQSAATWAYRQFAE